MIPEGLSFSQFNLSMMPLTGNCPTWSRSRSQLIAEISFYDQITPQIMAWMGIKLMTLGWVFLCLDGDQTHDAWIGIPVPGWGSNS